MCYRLFLVVDCGCGSIPVEEPVARGSVRVDKLLLEDELLEDITVDWNIVSKASIMWSVFLLGTIQMGTNKLTLFTKLTFLN